MSWFLKEQPDDHYEPPRGVRHVFGRGLADAGARTPTSAAWRSSRPCSARRSSCFRTIRRSPRERLGLGTTWLVWWVVAQNAGTALFSLLTGPIADALGNRLVLRIVTLLIVAGPLAALACIFWPDDRQVGVSAGVHRSSA